MHLFLFALWWIQKEKKIFWRDPWLFFKAALCVWSGKIISKMQNECSALENDNDPRCFRPDGKIFAEGNCAKCSVDPEYCIYYMGCFISCTWINISGIDTSIVLGCQCFINLWLILISAFHSVSAKTEKFNILLMSITLPQPHHICKPFGKLIFNPGLIIIADILHFVCNRWGRTFECNLPAHFVKIPYQLFSKYNSQSGRPFLKEVLQPEC